MGPARKLTPYIILIYREKSICEAADKHADATITILVTGRLQELVLAVLLFAVFVMLGAMCEE